MAEIIETRRVVVSASGDEYTSPAAFRRHEYQKSLGVERTRIKIAPVDAPLKSDAEPDFMDD